MNLRARANIKIPAPKNNNEVLFNDGTTGDIMHEVLNCFEDSKEQLVKFAPYLRGKDLYSTCQNIWQFVKTNIKYKVDPPGVQWVKEPARTWADKECDCKSYSIFIASCLYNLGIKGTFRFASFKKSDSTPTHVYVVVKDANRVIIIDGVMPAYDAEKAYTYKHDYNMTSISRLSGIGATASKEPVIMYPIDLMTKKILLEAEKGMYEKLSGVYGQPTAIYDKYIKDIDNMAARGIQPAVGNIFQKIGKGIKNVVKAVTKVALLPLTAPMRIALEKQIPAASDAFLYLFIEKPEIIAKLPDAIKKKRDKQQKLLNFLVDLMPLLKGAHIRDLARAGHIKKYNETPEVTLAKRLGFSINGIEPQIGIVPVVVAAIITLITKIIGLFKKKPPVTAEEVAPSSADYEDYNKQNPAAVQAVAKQILEQPNNTTLLEKVADVVKSGVDVMQSATGNGMTSSSSGGGLSVDATGLKSGGVMVDSSGVQTALDSNGGSLAVPSATASAGGMPSGIMIAAIGALALIFIMKKK